MTVGELLGPEHQRLAQQHEVWDCNVEGPISLDDPAGVTVTVHYGKRGPEHSRRYRLAVTDTATKEE